MKNLLTSILLISISQICFSQLTQGLVADFQFNGNLMDNSNSQIEATNHNVSFGEDRNGNPNSALEFGFLSSIEFNSNAVKVPLPVSISAWVKFNSLDTSIHLFMTDNLYENYNGYWINVLPNTGQLALNFSGGLGGANSTNRRSFISNKHLEAGVWHHFVGIIRSFNDMEIYVNCEKTTGYYNGTGSTTMVYSNTNSSIGSYLGNILGTQMGHDLGYYLYGNLDDFKIWNRSVSEDEIKELCRTVSTNEITKEQHVKIYPNPAKDIVTVYFDGFLDEAEIKILDINGRVIFQTKNFINKEISIPTNQFSKGIYIVKIQDSSNQISSKLVIE
jgi:hypothetical protein